MTGFEPSTYDIGSEGSANWATTTAQKEETLRFNQSLK